MIVSIAVISYNAENTIRETLESIMQQTYPLDKIEVIISDDCSTDRTVDIINEWLIKNKNVFNRTRFIEHTVNRGVSANCNSAWKSCKTDWVKTIAADDILLPNCITDNIDYVYRNPKTKALFSFMLAFDDKTKKIITKLPPVDRLEFFDKSSNQQYKELLENSFNIAPTSFLNIHSLSSIGFADERFSLIEDLPLWIRFTSSSIPLAFMEKETVKYRKGESLTYSNENFINVKFEQQLKDVYIKYIFPKLILTNPLYVADKAIDLNGKLLIAKLTCNKNNKFSKYLYISTKLIRPYTYLRRLKKISRKIKSN